LNAPSVNLTTYAGSGSGSESVSFATTTNGLTIATLAGSVASGDVIALTVTNSDLSGGSVTETYTTQTGDTLYTVADALSTSVNLDPLLQAVGQTANASANTTSSWSQTFSGASIVQPGSNSLSVTGTDGAGNTQTNNYQVAVNNGTPLSWIYDADGNFSYGPTQGYSFDPENRLSYINFFTTNNPETDYYFDALGRCACITLRLNGTITSQKIYVWSGDNIIQEQDASGSVTKDYYVLGENRTGTSYFYTKDHLGSIRELTDNSGNIQAQYRYDPYGQPTKIQGSLDCDFQYAGYCYEPTSGFSLTRYRAYSPAIGRWISRDPINERGGVNLFSYVNNGPVDYLDPDGTNAFAGALSGAEAGFTVGGPWGAVIGLGLGGLAGAGVAWGAGQLLQPLITPLLIPPTANMTPAELINDPKTQPMKPTKRGPQCKRPGGTQGQADDFKNLGPTNVTPIDTQYGPGQTGQFPDGSDVTMRPGSSSGDPTTQINLPDGTQIKIRY
jgi:RHS repeat-associated protein